jgi:hypothetical protein
MICTTRKTRMINKEIRARNRNTCHPLTTHLSYFSVVNNPEHVGSTEFLGKTILAHSTPFS